MGKRVIISAAAILFTVVGIAYFCMKVSAGDFAYRAGNKLYYQERDYEAALRKYKQVKPWSVHYATAQRYIGHNIYGREWGNWEEGIPYLEEALRIDPNDPKVLEDIGRAYVKVGRTNEAVDLLRRAKTDIAQTALVQIGELNGSSR
jgi:tetratricopeptide (TPR) repeat protein